MHYENPACHGSVTVGGVSVFANDGTSSTTTIEFDYSPGQTLVISEQDTCTYSTKHFFFFGYSINRLICRSRYR